MPDWNLEAKDWIAFYAACLSTLLACVKLGELWRDRFRLEIGYSFNGLETEADIIHVRNISNKPFILTHWELLYGRGWWPWRNFQTIVVADPDSGDRKVDPHSTLTLTFSEENSIGWSEKALKGRAIYIRLHGAGRGVLLRKVYSR